MADGLAGHEDDFYMFVNDSSWLHDGGREYSNLNEALPYWFNGLVPLAYGLDNARLKKQVHSVAQTVLGKQAADGWIGPETGPERNFWARVPLLLGLTQLVEANQTWEKSIVKSLRSFMTLTNEMLKDGGRGYTNCSPQIDCSWTQVRIQDLVVTIQWLLQRYPSKQDAVLWENMDMFYAQNQYKWDEWYTEPTYPQVVDPSNATIFPFIHGVNVGQGLKASAVFHRVNSSQSLVQKSLDAVDWTFKHHGAASGTILADELQRDLAPWSGSELCTAVETAYSLAYLYQALGRSSHADGAERVVFNALPAMMTGDKWAHQYMTQPNQPFALDTGGSQPFFTTANSGLATTFGMEPQYPCCTVNHAQGYAKFVANSWVKMGDSGLGHVLLSPSSLRSRIGSGWVKITCLTAYPFSDLLQYEIEAQVNFDLYIRVPEWAARSFKTYSSQVLQRDAQSGMHRVPIKAGKRTVSMTLGTMIRTEPRPNNTVAILYGNLVYSLDVGASQTWSLPHAYNNPRGPGIGNLPFPQLRDYYIQNTQPWNVAIDPSTLEYHGLGKELLPNPVFEQGAKTSFITVDGCEISWPLYRNVTPDWAPAERTCTGDKRKFRLVPHGTAKVHMSELPVVEF
ncbi:hypothetical protein CDD82_5071 [Ophiocordyceps australis]|uniref:Uncharacterized protein n=1 Tax=Ophiocordyceps australis TaxID=1399860 RepID=A0A2C5ZRU6_9HYPO|nr:hypothetical protein CDD82_5071 [Ophiocordyceps australis]